MGRPIRPLSFHMVAGVPMSIRHWRGAFRRSGGATRHAGVAGRAGPPRRRRRRAAKPPLEPLYRGRLAGSANYCLQLRAWSRSRASTRHLSLVVTI